MPSDTGQRLSCFGVRHTVLCRKLTNVGGRHTGDWEANQNVVCVRRSYWVEHLSHESPTGWSASASFPPITRVERRKSTTRRRRAEHRALQLAHVQQNGLPICTHRSVRRIDVDQRFILLLIVGSARCGLLRGGRYSVRRFFSGWRSASYSDQEVLRPRSRRARQIAGNFLRFFRSASISSNFGSFASRVCLRESMDRTCDQHLDVVSVGKDVEKNAVTGFIRPRFIKLVDTVIT